MFRVAAVQFEDQTGALSEKSTNVIDYSERVVFPVTVLFCIKGCIEAQHVALFRRS